MRRKSWVAPIALLLLVFVAGCRSYHIGQTAAAQPIMYLKPDISGTAFVHDDMECASREHWSPWTSPNTAKYVLRALLLGYAAAGDLQKDYEKAAVYAAQTYDNCMSNKGYVTAKRHPSLNVLYSGTHSKTAKIEAIDAYRDNPEFQPITALWEARKADSVQALEAFIAQYPGSIFQDWVSHGIRNPNSTRDMIWRFKQSQAIEVTRIPLRGYLKVSGWLEFPTKSEVPELRDACAKTLERARLRLRNHKGLMSGKLDVEEGVSFAVYGQQFETGDFLLLGESPGGHAIALTGTVRNKAYLNISTGPKNTLGKWPCRQSVALKYEEPSKDQTSAWNLPGRPVVEIEEALRRLNPN